MSTDPSVTSRLGLRFNNTYLGPATGFFYKFGDQIFLISNWHVFSGRSPDSGQPLASHGGTPNQIEFGAAHIEAGILGCNRILPLTDGSNLNLWIQHPEGQSVDIAALPISYEWILPKFSVANENGRTRAEMIARVGDELFILGYPRGLSKQANMPVWKRATIAAEPEILLEDGSKTYLVDTASREGMSGSPAILRSNSGIVPTGELGSVDIQDSHFA